MEAGTLTVGESDSATARAKDWAGRHPAGSALDHFGCPRGGDDRREGPARGRRDRPRRPLHRRHLRARRGRPDPRLRDPEARQLRPRRLRHVRGLHGLPGERHLGRAAGVRADLRDGRDRGARRPVGEDHVGADAAQARRAAAARADVDRARVPDPVGDPVRVGNRHPQPRRQQHGDGRVPRPLDRAHAADHDRRRHRRHHRDAA